MTPDQVDPQPQGGPARPPSRRRRVAGIGFLIVVVAAIGWAIITNREAFIAVVPRVGVVGIALSVACGGVSVIASAMQWRAVVGGLGADLGRADALRVFLVSQLGKYVPGSVWPVVMQMEAGRDRGASRKTMVAANVMTLVIALATGLVIAGVTLPFASAAAIRQYWWALAATPLAVVLALPKSLPFLTDRALALIGRQPLGVSMQPSASLAATGWGVVAWAGLGLHLTVLAAAIAGFSVSLLILCIGAMSLAVTAGILFIPAPAGAGLREVVLGFVLVSVVTPGEAIAVVVASRVLLIVVDTLAAAGAAAAVRRRPIGRQADVRTEPHRPSEARD